MSRSSGAFLRGFYAMVHYARSFLYFVGFVFACFQTNALIANKIMMHGQAVCKIAEKIINEFDDNRDERDDSVASLSSSSSVYAFLSCSQTKDVFAYGRVNGFSKKDILAAGRSVASASGDTEVETLLAMAHDKIKGWRFQNMSYAHRSVLLLGTLLGTGFLVLKISLIQRYRANA